MKNSTHTSIILVIIGMLFTAIKTDAQWSLPLNISPTANTALLNESMGSCLGVSQDTVHVVWCNKLTNTNAVIYYTRSLDSGLTWSNSIPLTSLLGNHLNPAIAVNGSSIHVVWRDIDTVTNKRSSHYRHSLDGGATWANEMVLDTAIGNWPTIAVSGNYVYVANDIYLPSFPNSDIFFLRSLDNGVTWSQHQQLTFAPDRSEDEALIAEGSHVHMSWNDKRTGVFQIFYKESSDYGVTWGPDVVVDTPYDYNTMVSVNGAHVDVIASGAPVGNHNQILLAQSPDAGATWSSINKDITNDTAHIYFYPHMVRDESDLHVVCGSNIGAKYLHSPDGGTTWDPPFSFNGGSTFIAYSGCGLHIICINNGRIFYLRNPTGNAGHCAITGVGTENVVPETIAVYPNPNSGQFTLSCHSASPNSSFQIIDVMGSVVYTMQLPSANCQLPISLNLSNGIYYWELKGDKGIEGKGKIVLIK